MSSAEIKKAYYGLAKKYHPDNNQGDETAVMKFKEASEAYEILSDASKKDAFDNFGHAGVNEHDFGEGQHESANFSSHFRGQSINIEDIFQIFFTSMHKNKMSRRGRAMDFSMNDFYVSSDDFIHERNRRWKGRKGRGNKSK